MKPWIKKILIATGVVFGLMVLLMVGIRSWLGTDQAQKWIQKNINTSIPGDITWESLGFSIFGGSVDIRNILLTDPDGQKLAGVDRLQLNMDWLPLFGGSVYIDSASIENPWADMVVDEQGVLNTTKAFPASEKQAEPPPKESSGLPVNIIVKKLDIHSGKVQYRMPGQKLTSGLEDINISAADVNLADKTGTLSVNIGKGAFENPQINTRLDSFNINTQLTGEKLAPLSVRIKSNKTQVEIDGAVDKLLSTPEIDLDLNILLALAEVRALLQLEPALDGELKVDLKARGRLDSPEAALTLSYGGGNIWDIPVKKIDGLLTLQGVQAVLDHLDVDCGYGQAHLKASGDLQPAFPGGFLGKEQHLDRITYHAELDQKNTVFQTILKETGLEGTVSSNLTLDGKGVTLETLLADFKLDATAKGFRTPGFTRNVDLDLKTDGRFENGAVTLKDLNITSDEIRIKGDAAYTLKSEDIRTQLHVTADDARTALSLFHADGIKGRLDLTVDAEGSVVHPQVRARLKAENAAYQEILIGNVDLDAALALNGKATIASLDIANQGSRLNGKGVIHLFEPDSWLILPGFPSELTLTLQDAEVKDFMPNLDIEGKIAADVRQTGGLLSPVVHLLLDAKNISAFSNRVGDVKANLKLDEGTVHIDSLALKNQESVLSLTGSTQVLTKELTPLEDPSFDLTLQNTTLFLENFIDTLKGKVLAEAKVSGKLSDPLVTASLKGTDLASGSTRIGDLTTALSLKNGRLTLTDTALKNQRSALALTGHADILQPGSLKPLEDPAFQLDLTSDGILLGDFIETMKGRLTAAAKVTGTLKHPEASLEVAGSSIDVSGNRIDDLSLNARFEKGRAMIEPLRVKSGKSSLSVNGAVRVLDAATGQPLKDQGLDLKIDGERLLLQDFLKNMSGQLALTGNVKGTVSRPEGNVTLSGEKLNLGGQNLQNIRLKAQMDGKRVLAEPLEIALTAKEKITGKGWYDIGAGAYDVKIGSEGVSLQNIDAFKGQAISGQVVLDVSGRGTIGNPGLEGNVGIQNLHINKKPLDDFRLRMEVKDHLARISGKPGFDLDGQYHLNKGDFSARLSFDKTRLTPYFKLGGIDDVDGMVSGTITARGNAAAPDKLEADADLSDLKITSENREFIRSDSIKASLKKGRLEIPGFRLKLLEKGHLQLRGSGRLNGAVSLSGNGAIPLKVIDPFTDQIDQITGDVNLTLALEGSFKNPDFRGEIVLDRLGFTINALGQKLHELSGRIRVTPQKLLINNIQGKLDNGRINLNGEVELKNFKPSRFDVQTSMSQLPLEVPDTLSLLLNSNVRLKGTPDKSLVSGEIVMLEGRYYKDIKINLLKDIGKKKRAEPTIKKNGGDENPLLKNMEINLLIKRKEPFFIENNLALMSLSPQLRVHGSAARPLIAGRATVDSGTITYQKREFEVKKGIIDFVNPYKIEPDIDIESQVEVRDWVILLTISGTPENLKFVLTSTPSEDHGDIVSLLVLGKTTKELREDEGGGSSSPAQLLANIVADKLQNEMKGATGLDVVELEMKEGDESEDPAKVKVTLGKELSRRIMVKYGAELKKGETVQRVTTEYKLLENLLVSAFQDTAGDFGGELKYRLEFR